MAGFSAVWSIDIGKFALKAVHLRRLGSQVVVAGTDRIDYDIGPEGVDAIGGAKEALDIFCSRNTVRDPVVVCLPGQDTLAKFIKIVADDDKKLAELVQFEARQQIPSAIDEAVWDWQLVPRAYGSGQEKEVGIFAARRETVDDTLIEFAGHGIQSQQITPGDVGLLNFVLYELRPKAPSIILDVGADHTAMILVDGNAFWIRALQFSGNQLTQKLAARFRLTFAEAERLKRQAAKSAQKDRIFAALQDALGGFVTEIQRSVGYYRNQYADTAFNQVYLLGQGSFLLGMAKYLQDRLDITVQRVASLSRLRAGDGVDVAQLRQQLASLAPAIGAGLQGLGVSVAHVDLMPHEQQVQLVFTRRRKRIFAAGAAMLLVLFVWGNIYARKTLVAAQSYSASQEKLKDIQDAEKDLPAPITIEQLVIHSEALAGVPAERRLLSMAIGVVDKVFASIRQSALLAVAPPDGVERLGGRDPRAETVFLIQSRDRSGNERTAEMAAASREATQFVERLHAEMAWLVSLDVKLAGGGAVEERRPRTGAAAARDGAAPAARDPTAYEFTLMGVILGKETPEESSKTVDARVRAPLAETLKSDPALSGRIVAEPKLMVVENPTIMAPAPARDDSGFVKSYHLIDPRRIPRAGAETERTTRRPVEPTEEGKYYLFGITWIIGQETVAADREGAVGEE